MRYEEDQWFYLDYESAIGTHQEHEHDQVHTVQDQHRTVAS